MIKEMTICISVSGETDGDCEVALIEAVDDLIKEMQYTSKEVNEHHSGNLDEGEEEMHWKYEIKTTE